MAKDFTEIDAAILARIHQAPCNFTQLLMPAIRAHAWELAIPDRRGNRDAGRVLDRRLQALRKRGLIAYSKGQWSAQSATARGGEG